MTAPDPGIDVLLDVYITGCSVGLMFLAMTRIADWYVQYRTSGYFTVLGRKIGTHSSKSNLNGAMAVFTWRTDLAFFFIASAPITLFCLFKAMEVAPDLDTALNELRGVVITATMSVLSVILMCADVLRLVFPHRRHRYKWIEAVTMAITLAFQIVNTVLVYFDSTAGVFRFDETFFPIHCAELFSTLLLTEGFLLYGIYSNVLNSRNAKKLHKRSMNVTLTLSLLTHFCHISLIVYNHREGITLASAVPRIVMLFSSFNLFVVVLHSLMCLVNRINDTIRSSKSALEMDSKSNKSKGTFVPTGVAQSANGRQTPKPPSSPRSKSARPGQQMHITPPTSSESTVSPQRAMSDSAVTVPHTEMVTMANAEVQLQLEESAVSSPMDQYPIAVAIGLPRSSTTSFANKFGAVRPSMLRIE